MVFDYLFLISLLLESLSFYRAWTETVALWTWKEFLFAIILESELHLKKRSE